MINRIKLFPFYTKFYDRIWQITYVAVFKKKKIFYKLVKLERYKFVLHRIETSLYTTNI